MKKYWEKLPRRARGHRCQCLDENGKRCGRASAWEVDAHLDDEIYEYPAWIALYVCQEHFDSQSAWK